MSLTPGTKLGHFEIVAALGEGGMGEVYRAHDDKLGRDVAIKVIRADALESADRRERFVREAKAAAVLNHPNIATVYEIDEADGLTFIAMELIEGDKLSDLIAAGGLSTDRATAIAIDVAEGLSAAHTKHIVHRDLKPANIMILEDGRAKIIDFGLAKLLESDSEAETATKAQAMVGTVAYMSPEQARSGEIDHRSDLFSFGIVLYEMLTGAKPFEGPSAPETLNAIINESMPRLPSNLASFQPVLDSCLAKNPDARYHDAREIASALRHPRASESHRREMRWVLAATIAGAAAVLIVVAILLNRAGETPAASLRIANPTLVTRAVGVENYPSWSPDGETLAYAASTNPNLFGGNWDIWVSQVRGEQALNRTADRTGDDRYPSWSPDGSQIAFFSVGNDAGIYVMSALAGGARRLATASAAICPPQWSPDGKEIAYSVADEVAIEMLTLGTGETRRIVPQHREGIFDLAWSPDGRYFAFVHARALVAQVTQLVVLRVSDGKEVELTDRNANVWSPTWRDDHTLAYVSNRGGTRDLWIQRLTEDGDADGEAVQMTTGVEVLFANFSKDGNKVAYAKGRFISNVWRTPIFEDRPATWSDAEQITHDQASIEFIDLAPSGTEIAMTSDRAGKPDLWIVSIAGGEMRSLTTDPTPDWHPSYSPDGTEILFYAYRSGNRDLWVVPAEGGAARQLTFDEGRDSYPTWSPDANRIAFDSFRGGTSDIWVLTRASGEFGQLTSGFDYARAPTWSPDGKWIVFDSGDSRFWRIPADGGAPESLGETGGALARFTPDGGLLLVTNATDGTGNIWAIDPETKNTRAITDLEGRPGGLANLALATDGEHVYFAWLEDISDIWVADVVDDR